MSGIRLHAECSGPAAGPVVVMGCSLGSTALMWQPVALRLAETYRVVVLETRGHGRSPLPPGPATIDDLGADALVTLADLGIERFAYVGLSLGGQVGMWLGSEVPDRIERLSLWATAPVIATAQSWRERIESVSADGMAAIAEASMGRWFTPSYLAANRADAAGWQAMVAGIDPAGYVACCEVLATSDLRDRLAAITAPTLVVAGSEDPTTPPSSMRTELADAIAGSRFEVLAPAAHLVAIEQAGAAADLLLDHLGSGGHADG
jgi:3-oxoadipate enol-lactonase